MSLPRIGERRSPSLDSPRWGDRPSSSAAWCQLLEEVLDARLDFVSDHTHLLDRTTGRIDELPILVSLAWVDGTSVPAPHGHDDVGRSQDLVRPGLGELATDVDPHLRHRLDGRGVDVAG